MGNQDESPRDDDARLDARTGAPRGARHADGTSLEAGPSFASTLALLNWKSHCKRLGAFNRDNCSATAIFAAADFAAVAAAGTLLPPRFVNATVDASLKIVAPASGSNLVARGRVVKASRLLTVCAADVFSVRSGVETLCATLLGTARNMDTAATP